MTDNLYNDILIFTGAGFSRPAGCKLSGEMLKDLENKSNDGSSNIFSNIEKKTIKFILSCLDYQARWRFLESNGKYLYIPNIEEFAVLLRRIKNRDNYLPYPVTGNWSDKLMILEQDFNKEEKKYESDLYTSIESKIINNCYQEWLCNINISNDNTSYLNQLKEFIQKKLTSTKIKLDVFTLNNDLLMEVAFKEENTHYIGFVSNKWVGFDKSDIDENTYSASRINYYKLHGSLDWIRLTDGTIKKKFNEKNNETIDNENVDIDPLLIFGHGSKIYTVDPFFSLLEMFKAKLKEKKYYLVIGYSFFDPHINNLIFNELMNNHDKILIIFNPKLNDELNEENNFEVKYNLKILKGEKKQLIIEEFENIQKNPLYSDLPEFNLKTISPESFEYIPIGTEEFLYLLKEGNINAFIDELKYDKEKRIF